MMATTEDRRVKEALPEALERASVALARVRAALVERADVDRRLSAALGEEAAQLRRRVDRLDAANADEPVREGA